MIARNRWKRMMREERIHTLIGKLPYIRRYVKSLEACFDIMTFEQRQEWRRRMYP